ncbi:hypothetical protein GIB67_023819 [Kingdonia uniflora]|uniref:Uncharacterized protein n=1 Tax=Kingdonia uniflora TaxID=39325 RepID=A0A7J7NFT7_9MAGN|nr:hypothetical protein GIB67_023819 [Kingdonia uniflora]
MWPGIKSLYSNAVNNSIWLLGIGHNVNAGRDNWTDPGENLTSVQMTVPIGQLHCPISLRNGSLEDLPFLRSWRLHTQEHYRFD